MAKNRGRGGKNRGRGGKTKPIEKKPKVEKEEKESEIEKETPNGELKDLFMKQSTFQEHFIAQRDNMAQYLSTLLALLDLGMEVKDSSKARCLAALWSHKKFKISEFLLAKKEVMGLTEVLKAVVLLDSNRKIRALEKKLNLLQKQKNVKQKTIGKLTSKINDLKREPVTGSLSGSLISQIKKWVKSIAKDDLQFYAIHLPTQPWKELADLLHLNPKKDFQEEWFLSVSFGQPAPEGSVVADCQKLSETNVLEFVTKHSLPYAFLRKNKELLKDKQVITQVASYTSLETLLWWYEEISSPDVDRVIKEKIASRSEPLNMGYGKLMERLLTFRDLKTSFYMQLIPVAEEKLQNAKIPLEPPVVCFGDASASMQVAIRVATIIASLMTALTNADLRFFNATTIIPKIIPRKIEDVLELTNVIKAEKMTSPAASLREYYDKKEKVKTFIMVSDEEENTPCKGDRFAILFEKYRKEVEENAEIVFISFLKSQTATGMMTTELNRIGISPFAEVRLDGNRPDLTKLDSLLVLLAAQSSVFPSVVQQHLPKIQNLLI